jgi:hypothetical protein
MFIVFAGTLLGQAPQVTVVAYDAGSPPLRFAATEIRRALAAAGSGVVECSLDELGSAPQGRTLVLAYGEAQIAQVRKTVAISPLKLQGQQSYAIRRAETMAREAYVALGADVVGAMYGGLELAEAVRNGTLKSIKDVEHSPYIARRGIKFNIPLDARTPSYSDNSDAAQQNIPEMWNFDFWREFLDEMARDRYNVLTLWNLHPFPSMVKVPEYPDVALADVMRTTIKMDDTYSHRGGDMVRPEILKNLETVRKMSIGEKIQFWRDVMQYAQDRGIEVYLFTWNIFTFGAEGKYGITSAQTNPATIDYFRKSVRETVLTYPLLAGIGITAGEQMDARKDEFSKEKWLWKTYGEGVRDALKLQPQRQFRMIHRYHETGQAEVLSEWKNYPGPFDLSFKYAIAHMYSIPNPSFIEPVLPNLGPKLRSWLTVRNDDIYSFRWADAEYARAFVRHIPGPDKIAGFYMGPDGFIWGRDFLGTNGHAPRELVMKKQWYSFLLWGRLGYEPDLPDENLEQIVAHRFPEVPVKRLMAAWAHASRVFPLITRFSWGDIDLRWYPEASLSHPKFKGFYTVKSFMEGATMPGSGVLDIVTWRERRLNNTAMNGTTPLEIAAELKSNADSALPQLAQLRAMQGKNEELKGTLGDIEAMSHLANYYAEKILAATDLALYDKTNDSGQQASAVRHLESALAHWKKYASAYSKQYKPQLLNRVGYVDIPALVTKVEEDVRIAKEWKPGSLTIDPKSRMRDNPFRP